VNKQNAIKYSDYIISMTEKQKERKSKLIFESRSEVGDNFSFR
jgi:hypothetical protein